MTHAHRYVGVTSGGMDQAISMMGKIGVAELIDFNPVRFGVLPLSAPSCHAFQFSCAIWGLGA